MPVMPLLGLLLTLAFLAVTGIYPGGLIVPAYLVLFISQPPRLAGTVAAALLALLLYRLACRFWILFGRRRFVFMILSSALIAQAMAWLLPAVLPFSESARVIGWVIPGLLASQMERQGIARTLLALVIVMALTYVAFAALRCF